MSESELKQIYQAAARGELSSVLPTEVKFQLEQWARPGSRLFFRMVKEWCVNKQNLKGVYWTCYRNLQNFFAYQTRVDEFSAMWSGRIPVPEDYQDYLSMDWVCPIALVVLMDLRNPLSPNRYLGLPIHSEVEFE